MNVVVIGAGIGGLTAAAALARSGLSVTVLEAHVYPGGCAGTFYHRGYRFDAGATLAAGFYPDGPMDQVARAAGIGSWTVQAADVAMVVHLPGGSAVHCYGDRRRWAERERAFGRQSAPFWRWQEETSDQLWDLALRQPSWPPQKPADLADLAHHGLAWLGADLPRRLRPGLALDAMRPAAAHLGGATEALRLFVDAQLLISAQATGRYANALYGAAALDLPRRGVAHAVGGMGAVAEELVAAVRRAGGQVLFRQAARRIATDPARGGRPAAVETSKGCSFPADLVIANLPPHNLVSLLGAQQPRRLRRLSPRPEGLWGAFMLYVGLDGSVVPEGLPLHHQVVLREPMGNGNTVFLSLSPSWDRTRAPAARRALTISSHTELGPWWNLFESDRPAYEARRAALTARVLEAAEIALPGLRGAADLVLPATPVTFQRFTRRAWGWVGGFPQTHLLRAWGPRLAPGLWLVGDSIFPGQSVPAAALGGLRVARMIEHEA